MRRVIVGTAGHVDHGKTRLVEALTGIDCDRWEEEKRRGITIDIGFAHFVDGDLQVGFIDVPGHEKFLHNALAGLGGIRLALLVVAADEGIKPQTREHLAVCDLLAIPAAVVALAKADLVTGERLAQVRSDVAALLAATRFAGAPTVPVSALAGTGVTELRQALVAAGGEHASEPDDRPARLPVDRAFLVKGRGLVVTGTLAAGAVATGAELAVTPDGGEARVRGLQVHGEERAGAEAGERVALQLVGVELESVPRGAQLVAPGSLVASRRWLADCRLLAEAPRTVRGTVSVRLHLYSEELLGTLRPLAGPLEPGGASGTVEIRLARPLVAARGDRFVLRRPSPALTFGGGAVLDPLWHRHRGARLAAALDGLSGGLPEAARFWVEDAGEAGLGLGDLAARLGWTAAAARSLLDPLVEAQRAIRVDAAHGHGERWLGIAALRRIEERARRVLGDYFARHRTQAGMPRAAALAALFPGPAAALAQTHLQWLARSGVLEVRGDKIGLPGRGPELSGGESKLALQILAAYEAAGLTPPPPAEVRAALGAKAQILDGVVSYLLEQGRLVRLPGDLLIAAAALDELRAELTRMAPERLTVGDFKQRFGLTRKWAIPLLEHLDSIGFTRRVGNDRQLVRGLGTSIG